MSFMPAVYKSSQGKLLTPFLNREFPENTLLKGCKELAGRLPLTICTNPVALPMLQGVSASSSLTTTYQALAQGQTRCVISSSF